MKTPMLFAFPLLALAACDAADTGPKTPAQAAAEMKQAVKMKPGKWQTTMQMTKFDIPGAPPEAAAMMKGAMQATTSESCLTKEEADKDPSEFIKKGQQGDCTFERFDVAGSALDGKMVCTNKGDGGKVEATMKGTLGAEAMSMTIDSVMTGGAMPGGKAEVGMKMDAKRIGECS